MDTPKLPVGYFDKNDIEAYKRLVEGVPQGGNMVEIGVYCGRPLCSVAKEIKEREINVCGVDSFEGDVIGDLVIKNPEAVKKVFWESMKAFGLKPGLYVAVSPVGSMHFQSETLDLVFIDASHDTESVVRDINDWMPKVKRGGVISGHDYQNPMVRDAVEKVLPKAELVGGSVWAYRKGEA